MGADAEYVGNWNRKCSAAGEVFVHQAAMPQTPTSPVVSFQAVTKIGPFWNRRPLPVSSCHADATVVLLLLLLLCDDVVRSHAIRQQSTSHSMTAKSFSAWGARILART
jgi:hypothetical protein